MKQNKDGWLLTRKRLLVGSPCWERFLIIFITKTSFSFTARFISILRPLPGKREGRRAGIKWFEHDSTRGLRSEVVPSQKSRALLLLAARLMQSEMSSTSIFSSLHSNTIFTSCQSQVTNVSSLARRGSDSTDSTRHGPPSRHGVKRGVKVRICHFLE